MASELTPSKRHYLRADERRRAILDVAGDLVAERGLSHLSMAGIATQAGVSRQLLYRYFSGIDDLVLAMVTHRFAAMIANYDALTSKRPPNRDGVAKNQIDLALRLAPSDQRLLRNVFGDVAQLAPEIGRAVVTIRQRLVDRWVTLIDDDPARRSVLSAAVWAVFYALFGIWDYLALGVITDDEARIIADRLASSIIDLAPSS